MRYLLSLILSLIGWPVLAMSANSADSLLNQLKKTHSSVQRIQIYRNLADIHLETPLEKTYLLKMYQEAKKSNDKNIMVESLNDIIILEAKTILDAAKENKDSITKYIDLIKEVATPEKIRSLLPLYHMRCFNTLCKLNKGEEAIEEELNFLKSEDNDIYRRIASAYNTGNSLYLNQLPEKAIPYLENAFKMAESLPERDKYEYRRSMISKLCYAYTQTHRNKKAIQMMEDFITQVEQDYKLNYQKQRPFYKIDLFRLQYYTFMIANTSFLESNKEKFYWNRIQQIGKHLTNPIDLYNYYLCSSNYYLIKNDFSKSLAANDTLIKYAKTFGPLNLPGLYEISSALYENMEDYKNSLKYLKMSHQIKDSINSHTAQQQLNELQVKYNLNKLNSEKNELEIKNKRTLVFFLTAFLIIAVIVCTYLYYSLRKEKKMKVQLNILHTKAQESDKMKQAFINSICHEIRTPLNAIVGFSDLIMNPEIDEEMKREFPAEIQRSTNLLTSLVNSMLEVADLDVSEEKLPCESVDIRDICIREMDVLKASKKIGIDYQLDIPEETLVVSTHERYLSMVVGHLLENANKFTEQGCITLGCRLDTEKNRILLNIADTGCGIPAEKREEVFQRFAKLDSFTPGNGLGLYLCRLIVKRLDGEITIDSEYTGGTHIIVSLPI